MTPHYTNSPDKTTPRHKLYGPSAADAAAATSWREIKLLETSSLPGGSWVDISHRTRQVYPGQSSPESPFYSGSVESDRTLRSDEEADDEDSRVKVSAKDKGPPSSRGSWPVNIPRSATGSTSSSLKDQSPPPPVPALRFCKTSPLVMEPMSLLTSNLRRRVPKKVTSCQEELKDSSAEYIVPPFQLSGPSPDACTLNPEQLSDMGRNYAQTHNRWSMAAHPMSPYTNQSKHVGSGKQPPPTRNPPSQPLIAQNQEPPRISNITQSGRQHGTENRLPTPPDEDKTGTFVYRRGKNQLKRHARMLNSEVLEFFQSPEQM